MRGARDSTPLRSARLGSITSRAVRLRLSSPRRRRDFTAFVILESTRLIVLRDRDTVIIMRGFRCASQRSGASAVRGVRAWPEDRSVAQRLLRKNDIFFIFASIL